jgi:hypothetical protein
MENTDIRWVGFHHTPKIQVTDDWSETRLEKNLPERNTPPYLAPSSVTKKKNIKWAPEELVDDLGLVGVRPPFPEREPPG